MCTNDWNPEDHVPSEVKDLLQNAEVGPYTYISAFIQVVELLKTRKRTGWLNMGIDNAESISDHMYRMSIISMSLNTANFKENSNLSTAQKEPIDLSQCIKISLVHDIAEALVGDITPKDTTVTKQQKYERELAAINYLGSLIDPYNSAFAKEMVNLWLDYEEQRNFEARIVKDIDKYEFLVQAVQYEKRYKGSKRLDEFFEGTRQQIKTDEVGRLADEILHQRVEFWKFINKNVN
ncbi:hypothetical protein LJB42_004666 [Komagataella kurtzmanii]|nr:hypothetical protein LJB42_004666 [Komagataella kurtzmanii]